MVKTCRSKLPVNSHNKKKSMKYGDWEVCIYLLLQTQEFIKHLKTVFNDCFFSISCD